MGRWGPCTPIDLEKERKGEEEGRDYGRLKRGEGEERERQRVSYAAKGGQMKIEKDRDKRGRSKKQERCYKFLCRVGETDVETNNHYLDARGKS